MNDENEVIENEEVQDNESSENEESTRDNSEINAYNIFDAIADIAVYLRDRFG